MNFERTPEQVKEFVRINHHLMTIKEMAEEAGRTVNTIGKICKDLGVVAISETDRKKDTIRANQDLTAEQIAALINTLPHYVKTLSEQMGIFIHTEESKRLEEKKKLEQQAAEPPILLWSTEALEYINEVTGYTPPQKKKEIKRAPGVYNQTGSQFTDELRGIKTTERIK